MIVFLSYIGVASCGLLCPDAIDRAVLDKLYPRFGGTDNYLSVWLSHNYNVSYWKPRLDAQSAELGKVYRWAASSHLDYCVFSAYMGWIEYYRKELASAWDELRTQKEKREMDAYEENNRREREAARKVHVPEPLR